MATDFPKSWELRPIADCMSAIIDYRGKSPRKTTIGIPLITAKIVKGGRILPPEEFIAPGDYDSWMRRGMPEPGDILLTTEAPLGEVAQLGEGRVALAQRLITLRGKAGILDNTFLKFVLQSDFAQDQLRARGTGTTVHGIRQSELRRVQLPVPPFKEQRAIAHILGTLDEKIELNRHMNETLEAMARAIFKSWFVDFDPVRAKAERRQPFGMDAETAALFPDSFEDSSLGRIPKGWKGGQVSQLVELTHNTLNPGEYPNEIFAHYSIPAFDESRWPAEEAGIRIKSNKTIVPRGAVLLSKLNPRIPRVWMPPVDTSRRSIASTEFLVATPKGSASREYVFCLFNSQAFLDVFGTLVTGTSGSHQRVRPESLLAIGVAIAPPQVWERFTKLVAPLLSKEAANVAESRTLGTVRNTLLPKLMSGEIRLKAFE